MDGAEELAAWRAAAIAGLVAWFFVLSAGAIIYSIWHRKGESEFVSTLLEDAERGECSPRPSPTSGMVAEVVMADKELNGHVSKEISMADKEFREKLRELVREELSRGLQRASDCNQSLNGYQANGFSNGHAEHRDVTLPGGQSFPLMCNGIDLPPSPGIPADNSGPLVVDLSLPRPVAMSPAPPQGEPAPCQPAVTRGTGPAAALVSAVPSQSRSVDASALESQQKQPQPQTREIGMVTYVLGPTKRQGRMATPPEKNQMMLGQEAHDRAMRNSITTIQRQVLRRESQTQELQRQIRLCNDVLRQRSADCQLARERLGDLVADPSLAPRMLADEISKHRQMVEDLKKNLSEAKRSSLHWEFITKQQQTFFMQRQRLEILGGAHLARSHPAGELLLAPPPICLEGDEEDNRKPLWDIGTLVIDPYSTDSWPFEPNVLAQRCNMELTLDSVDEDDEEQPEDDEEIDYDDDGEDLPQEDEYHDDELNDVPVDEDGSHDDVSESLSSPRANAVDGHLLMPPPPPVAPSDSPLNE